jgi:hypothetical protein
MRATALLQRLPHSADTPRPRRSRRSRRRHTAATHTANPHLATPASEQSATDARVRLAGGPIDNASYTCACGFVFAASVSTTVRCPHCGADQAW